MNRRSFLALASGLLVPMPERLRAYSFVGGWKRRDNWDIFRELIEQLDREMAELIRSQQLLQGRWAVYHPVFTR